MHPECRSPRHHSITDGIASHMPKSSLEQIRRPSLIAPKSYREPIGHHLHPASSRTSRTTVDHGYVAGLTGNLQHATLSQWRTSGQSFPLPGRPGQMPFQPGAMLPYQPLSLRQGLASRQDHHSLTLARHRQACPPRAVRAPHRVRQIGLAHSQVAPVRTRSASARLRERASCSSIHSKSTASPGRSWPATC